MGKLIISMAIFNGYVKIPEGNQPKARFQLVPGLFQTVFGNIMTFMEYNQQYTVDYR